MSLLLLLLFVGTGAGGGCKKLFRKIGNRSSEFYPDVNEVRRDGSYIYEEFVETQGTDVKMYTYVDGLNCTGLMLKSKGPVAIFAVLPLLVVCVCAHFSPRGFSGSDPNTDTPKHASHPPLMAKWNEIPMASCCDCVAKDD